MPSIDGPSPAKRPRSGEQNGSHAHSQVSSTSGSAGMAPAQLPRTSNSQSPSPRTPNSQSTSPSAQNSQSPSPSAPNSQSPLTRAPNSQSPLTRAPNSHSLSPSVPNSQSSLYRAPNSSSASPSVPNSQSPSPIALNSQSPLSGLLNSQSPSPIALNSQSPLSGLLNSHSPSPMALPMAPNSQSPLYEALNPLSSLHRPVNSQSCGSECICRCQLPHADEKSNNTAVTNDNSSQNTPNDISHARRSSLIDVIHYNAATSAVAQAIQSIHMLQNPQLSWTGFLLLKQFEARIKMHLVSGNPTIATDSLPPIVKDEIATLRMSKKMQLIPSSLDALHHKIQKKDEHCVLVAFPYGNDQNDLIKQTNNLKLNFIDYLQEKMSAGVICVAEPDTKKTDYVIHLFPFCDFIKNNMATIAPTLTDLVHEILHMVIIITTV